jgi:hypothetical protein
MSLNTNSQAVLDVANSILAAMQASTGVRSDLTGAQKDTLVAAINEALAAANTANSKIGDLETLTTTDKTSVVNAINEIEVLAAAATDIIDDEDESRFKVYSSTQTNLQIGNIWQADHKVYVDGKIDDDVAGTETAYSSAKVVTLISGAIAALIDGASADSNTLKELAEQITALGAADANLVSVLSQVFTDAQKAQARTNIGAASLADSAIDSAAVITGLNAIG